MKTQMQSLFLVLLLVFSTIPAFALQDGVDKEKLQKQPTAPVVVDAKELDTRGKEPVTFWLYPGDQKKLESNLVLTYTGPSQKATDIACTEELKLCPDSKTYVGRDSTNGCAFNACPGETGIRLSDDKVCEQFSMTFATPAGLNKPLVNPDVNPQYAEEYKKLEAALRTDYDRAVAEGDEEKVIKLKEEFEEQTQALSKKYSVETSDDVAYAYPEKENSDTAYTYPYDFEDFPEDKEVTKLKEEFERKYAKAVAEGEEEKMAKLKEEYLRKFDKIVVKKYDADASRQPIIGKPGKQGMMTVPMRSETKTFCILPGEVGYPIMLYEKQADGAVLVGYNAWKGENPSYYVAANGQARQTSYGSPQEKDSCQVEGNGAIPVGTRLNVKGESQYCDALTKKMMVQKQDGEQAENDYECLSNEQNNGQCVNSLNILQKIWKGITSIFGF